MGEGEGDVRSSCILLQGSADCLASGLWIELRLFEFFSPFVVINPTTTPGMTRRPTVHCSCVVAFVVN